MRTHLLGVMYPQELENERKRREQTAATVLPPPPSEVACALNAQTAQLARMSVQSAPAHLSLATL